MSFSRITLRKTTVPAIIRPGELEPHLDITLADYLDGIGLRGEDDEPTKGIPVNRQILELAKFAGHLQRKLDVSALRREQAAPVAVITAELTAMDAEYRQECLEQ